MSYYDRTKSSSNRPRKASKSAPANWAKKPLSNAQKAKLSIAARTAWDIQVETGLASGSFDDWKHAENKVACGLESIRDATNSQFRSILAHFLKLAGKTSESKKLWSKTGRVAGSTDVHDTHENREVARAIITDLLQTSNGRMNDAYIAAILADQHKGRSYHDLTAKELQQLVFTLTARLRKMSDKDSAP
jgi:hypothetical protein